MKYTIQHIRKLLPLIYESFRFARESIVNNKLRMTLSLLGITIGIFSVISVLTVFDSMKISIEQNISKLGSRTLFIGKFPWKGESKTNWMKLSQRPNLTYKDMVVLQKNASTLDAVAIYVTKQGTVKYKNKTVEGTSIVGVSHDYAKIMNLEIDKGRYFTERESASGANVTLAGKKIAEKLLGKNPLNKTISFKGKKLNVIGVLAPSGNFFGGNTDNAIVVPFLFLKRFFNLKNNRSAQIAVLPRAEVETDVAKEEIRVLMRSIHRLKPKAEDDFEINEISVVTEQFNTVFNMLNWVGWIIGGFSLLVGGFGIANIMFVSVKERTREIGIQMALGAKRYFILLQFLFEAVFLSLFGGMAGLLLIFFLILIANMLLPFPLVLTAKNIITGIGVSVFIGLIAGIIPAYIASKMDPVEAMRAV